MQPHFRDKALRVERSGSVATGYSLLLFRRAYDIRTSRSNTLVFKEWVFSPTLLYYAGCFEFPPNQRLPKRTMLIGRAASWPGTRHLLLRCEKYR